MSQSKFDVVTGGAGFIGSHLVRALLSRGRAVRVVDDFSSGKEENLQGLAEQHPGRFSLERADIRNSSAMLELLQGAEHVYHQAAMTSVAQSVEDPHRCHQVNAGGTLKVLEAARRGGAGKVVMASTTAVYGDDPELPKRETMLPSPISPYAAGKLAAEGYGQVYSRLYGLPVVALRYFNVYGPRQDPQSEYAAVIPKFISRMAAGSSPVIFGDGEQSRDFVFVEDVVRANLLAARSEVSGLALNVASGATCNLKQIVALLNEILGADLQPIFEQARAGDIKHSSADTSKARLAIGFQAQVTFKEGLSRAVAFYREAASGSPAASGRSS
ncbi:MAG TPA: SDR family oxidoreductase [Acidobacteriota bacterium]|nr:SDR family oxidoreductase [Acidobacteriota bacterium]